MPSSLAAETLGVDEGLANAIYLRALFTQMVLPGLTARTTPTAAVKFSIAWALVLSALGRRCTGCGAGGGGGGLCADCIL